MMKVKISKQYSFWLFILLGVLVGHLWSNPEDEWVIIQLSNDTNDTLDRIDTIETIDTIDTIETIDTIDTIDKNDTVVVIDSTIHKRNPPPEKTVLLARKKYNELKQTRHIQDLYVPGSWYLLNHGLLTFTFEKYPFNENKRGSTVTVPYSEGGSLNFLYVLAHGGLYLSALIYQDFPWMTHISATRFYSMMGYGAPFFVLQAMGVDQSAVPHDILAVIGYFGGLGYGTYKAYRMNADPGRLQLEANLGLIGMSLGGFSAYVFSETNSQTGGLMVVGATGAGMLVGKYYRAGEKLPMGVGAGILLETILWSGLGFGVIAQTTHSSEFKSKVMMAGMGFGGAGIALYTHRNSYSTLFRTVLDGVGVGLGVLVGSLVGQRIGGEKAIAAALSISVPVHYITFHWLTRGMQHKPIDEEQANHIHFNPLPQIWMSKQADGTFKKGWHVQALRVTF